MLAAPGGPLDIPLADARQAVTTAPTATQLAAIRRKIDAFKAAQPGRAAAGARPQRQRRADRNRSCSSAATRTTAGRRCRGRPRRSSPAGPQAVHARAAAGSNSRRPSPAPDNPLTARVMVNRVWLGALRARARPHAERLRHPLRPADAPGIARLARACGSSSDGWSVKKLHKLIMLSATYQQSSGVAPRRSSSTPRTGCSSHQNRRRLDFEALRDSLLVGRRQARPARPAGKPVDLFKAPFTTRRTVYGVIDRHEPARHVPRVRRGQPGPAQPAAVPDDRPAAGAVPDEQPVRDRAGEGAGAAPGSDRGEVAGREGRRRCTGSLSAATPTKDGTGAGGGVRGTATTTRRRPFGKWPQLAQVLLLSNEFAFVD